MPPGHLGGARRFPGTSGGRGNARGGWPGRGPLRRASKGPTRREEGAMEGVGPKTRTWEETLAATCAPCSELPARASSDTPRPHTGPALPPPQPATAPAGSARPFGAWHGAPRMPGCIPSAQEPSLPSLLSHRSDQILTYSWVLPPCSFIDVSPVNLLPGSFHSGVCFSKDPD